MTMADIEATVLAAAGSGSSDRKHRKMEKKKKKGANRWRWCQLGTVFLLTIVFLVLQFEVGEKTIILFLKHMNRVLFQKQ